MDRVTEEVLTHEFNAHNPPSDHLPKADRRPITSLIAAKFSVTRCKQSLTNPPLAEVGLAQIERYRKRVVGCQRRFGWHFDPTAG